MTSCFVMQFFSFSNYFGFMTSCLCHAAQFFAQISSGFMISHLCLRVKFLLKSFWFHDILLMSCHSISCSSYVGSTIGCLCDVVLFLKFLWLHNILLMSCFLHACFRVFSSMLLACMIVFSWQQLPLSLLCLTFRVNFNHSFTYIY